MLSGVKLIRSIVVVPEYVSKRFAGHNKWANIRHIKAEKDGQRSLLFVQLCRKIQIAIQDGGSSNPAANLHLSQAIETAKSKNMPIASIQNCIKNAQSDKNNQKAVWFEIKGPRGCYIMAHALTDAPKRTRDNISSILRRNGGMLADSSGRHLFHEKGIIIATSPNSSDSLEIAVDDAIDSGAEEVELAEIEGQLKFICSMKDLQVVRTKLLAKNYEIISADFDVIPKNKVELSDAEMEVMGKMMDKLEDHPDIVSLYDNIA